MELLEEFAGLLDELASAAFSWPGVFFGQWRNVIATEVRRINVFIPIRSKTKANRSPDKEQRPFFELLLHVQVVLRTERQQTIG